jgi:hypothetical protein
MLLNNPINNAVTLRVQFFKNVQIFYALLLQATYSIIKPTAGITKAQLHDIYSPASAQKERRTEKARPPWFFG